MTVSESKMEQSRSWGIHETGKFCLGTITNVAYPPFSVTRTLICRSLWRFHDLTGLIGTMGKSSAVAVSVMYTAFASLYPFVGFAAREVRETMISRRRSRDSPPAKFPRVACTVEVPLWEQATRRIPQRALIILSSIRTKLVANNL